MTLFERHGFQVTTSLSEKQTYFNSKGWKDKENIELNLRNIWKSNKLQFFKTSLNPVQSTRINSKFLV